MLNPYGYSSFTRGSETLQTDFMELLQRHTLIMADDDPWRVWLVHESTLLAQVRQNTLGAVTLSEFNPSAHDLFRNALWHWPLQEGWQRS